jgi:hypothetical protein
VLLFLLAALSPSATSAQTGTIDNNTGDSNIPWGIDDGDQADEFDADIFGEDGLGGSSSEWQALLESYWGDSGESLDELRVTLEAGDGAWLSNYLARLAGARSRTNDATELAVADEMRAIAMELWTGSFSNSDGPSLGRNWEVALLRELVSTRDDAPDWMIDPLVGPNRPDAAAAAQALVQGLEGLLGADGQLRATLIAFNDFVAASSPEFLANPPAEFLYYKALLGWLAEAAMRE